MGGYAPRRRVMGNPPSRILWPPGPGRGGSDRWRHPPPGDIAFEQSAEERARVVPADRDTQRLPPLVPPFNPHWAWLGKVWR